MTTIPSILEHQLKKSVAMTANRGAGMSERRLPDTHLTTSVVPLPVPIEQPHQDNKDNTLDRLKKLLAETKEMVKRAEALVSSMRCPQDCYKTHGR